jgi:hypothetical protein
MKPLYLKITEHHLVYSDDINTLDEGSFELDSNLELKQNFHNFKENISDSINIIVIMNSPQTILKKIFLDLIMKFLILMTNWKIFSTFQ